MGQRLGVNLTWKQTELTREFDDKKVRLHESALDTTTVGDFMPFQTGQLNAGDTGWVYSSCVGEGTGDACIGADEVPHIPAKRNEPLAFIQTDKTFIADHNDVFNDNVSAYLAAIIGEARYKRVLSGASDKDLPKACHSDEFGPCFDAYQALFESVKLEDPGEGAP